MYIPQHYTETRLEALHALMRTHPLATIVTTSRSGPVANHVPLELDPTAGPNGTLRGHVARVNPVWHDHAADQPVLVIFQGPQAYVSPAWYPSKRTDPRVVPTWNYAVVHAYGRATIIHDRAWLHELVTRLTSHHERDRPEPWHVTDAPPDYVERMLHGIVGFEIPIERLEGKWKMSQNHPTANRAGVVDGLRSAGDAESNAVAAIVKESGSIR